MRHLLLVLIILGIPVGAWYFIRSAVASGVRAANRPEKPAAPPDDAGGPQG